MIKMDNVKETSDVKPEVSGTYRDIIPKDSLSRQEINDFISKEFSTAHAITEFDTYDRLLSEVFNRSEDDIEIDFTPSEKVKALLESFKPENWNTKADSERKDLIKVLAEEIAGELDLDEMPEIKLSEADDAYGYYDPANNTITINSLFVNDPVELVNTLAHELRHAYQHKRAEMLETREDALYLVNYENYISPIPLPAGGWLFFTDYSDQYVEVDARAFADKFTEAMQ